MTCLMVGKCHPLGFFLQDIDFKLLSSALLQGNKNFKKPCGVNFLLVKGDQLTTAEIVLLCFHRGDVVPLHSFFQYYTGSSWSSCSCFHMHFRLDLVGSFLGWKFLHLRLSQETYKKPQIKDICQDKRFFNIVYFKEMIIQFSFCDHD